MIHKAARLEKLGILKTIITQNVDGLHQMAGNTDVIEFHGNFAWQQCMDCNRRLETAKIDTSQIPPRCECGGIYRPECVFFGEMIPPQHLYRSQRSPRNAILCWLSEHPPLFSLLPSCLPLQNVPVQKL